MRSKVFRLSADAADRWRFDYFLMAVIVIRYETTATARRASLFSVRAFFNDTIAVAIWTGFHMRLMRMLPHPSSARPEHSSALPVMSALPPKADMCSANTDVR